MSTYVVTITLVGIAEILLRTFVLGRGTWRPSTREEYVVGLCVWIGLVLWGLYVLAADA